MDTLYKIFIQNTAGSKIKNRHNEKTLEHLDSIELSIPYPYPYGFILETTTDDGDNVDCFIFTKKRQQIDTIVDCYVIGLLEIFEEGETDHKVIALIPEEQFDDINAALDSVREFYESESKIFRVGNYLSANFAKKFIERHSNNLI